MHMLETAAMFYVYGQYFSLFTIIGVIILYLLATINKKIFIYGILVVFVLSVLLSAFLVVSKLS